MTSQADIKAVRQLARHVLHAGSGGSHDLCRRRANDLARGVLRITEELDRYPFHEERTEAIVKGTEFGMGMAIEMARDGNLRLGALPFELGVRPRQYPIRPIKATRMVWKGWFRETFSILNRDARRQRRREAK